MKSEELKAQRAGLIADARNLMDLIESEKRDPSDEEKESFRSKMADADQLKKDIEKHEDKERLAHVEAEMRQSAGRKTITSPARHEIRTEDRKAAMRAWCLKGTNLADNSADTAVRAAQCGVNLHSDSMELRALSVGTASAGGYTVPTLLSQEIEKALKYYSNLRPICKNITTATGGELDWPTVTDVANVGAVVAEAGAPATNVDPTFGKVALKSQVYHSDIVKISVQLLQDNVVDIEALLADLLAERISRKQEADFMNGVGGGTAPNGLVTGAAVGVNLATSNPMTFAKLKSLEHSVDIAYRRNGSFLMHDLTFAAIEQLVDTQGRPLFIQNLNDASQYKLFGYPVYITNQFTNYIGSEGDNAPLILFGDFKRYLIRDVAEGFVINRFNELYAGNMQVGFQLWNRAWSDYIGPSGCIKSLNSFDS